MNECRVYDSLAPGVERITQCFCKFAEIRLVEPPFADAGPIDRLSNLLGTRGMNRSFRFKEAQAPLIKWQSNIVEKPPNLGFCVLDKIVIDDAMDLALS